MNKFVVLVGIVCMMLMSSAIASEVEVNMDVDSGSVDVSVDNDNAGVGFTGVGSFSGSLNSVEQGSYLDTNVVVGSSTDASLNFGGYQELSGYTDNAVEVETFASGDNVYMNNRFDNSNYVVYLTRGDTGSDFLSGSGEYALGWRMAIVDGEDSSAGVEVSLYGEGSGRFDTNQWHPVSAGTYGWGSPDSINAPQKPGYYTPENVVEATGEGSYMQYTYGDNNVEANGFVLGGGSITTVANFNSGFAGSYYSRSS